MAKKEKTRGVAVGATLDDLSNLDVLPNLDALSNKVEDVEEKSKGLISLLFDIIVNKNNDSSAKLKLLGKTETEKDKKSLKDGKDGKEGIEKILGKEKGKDLKDKGKPELNLPTLRYFDLQPGPKVDYGKLFSYLGQHFKTQYDEYRAFRYEGEDKVELDNAIQQRKYERIIEKEMMVDFKFFAMDHIKPEDKEAYNWDMVFGFRKSIMFLQYYMKPGALRVVSSIVYFEKPKENANAENAVHV
ncbi:MAG: hypothetical protein Q8O89_08035 [Nanoarchaeota archaeon]|nr:hypothetical protein [Nanoarchaeota archaeon]